MVHTRLHTGTPQVDPRFPHFAPIMGAQPLINEPEQTLEQALADAPVRVTQQLRPDPWPEVAVGVGTAAFSGAVTGGIAAGSWVGAGIGAGLTASAWSGFTFLQGWRAMGSRARGVLASAFVVGAVGAIGGVWWRQRGRRR